MSALPFSTISNLKPLTIHGFDGSGQIQWSKGSQPPKPSHPASVQSWRPQQVDVSAAASDEPSIAAIDDDTILAIYWYAGEQYLGEFNREGLLRRTISLPKDYTALKQLHYDPIHERIALIGENVQTPPEIAIMTRDGGAYRILKSDGTGNAKPPLYRHMAWQSADGLWIEGCLYLPTGDPPAKGWPLIMPVHDGPHKAVRADWPIKAHYFTSRGYAVFYVNYRGSIGRGEAFKQAIYHHVDQAAQDLDTGRAHVIQHTPIHAERVALWGGRFGGWLTLLTLHLSPKNWRCGVVVYPLLPPYVPAELATSFDAKTITCPVALFHGKLDPLVPSTLIENLSAALPEQPPTSFLKIYDQLTDRFNPADWADYYQHVTRFYTQWLAT